MAEQKNNLLILAENGDVRGLRPADDSLLLQVPLEVTKDAKFSADMSVGGDLTVAGDIVSRGTVNVVSKDSVLDLGVGNYSGTAQPGGFTVQVNKAAAFAELTITAFQSKADAAGDANFTVADASTLAVGMVVAITGASDGENDGYYVVKSKAGGVVSVEPNAMYGLPFAQTNFKTATEPAGDKCKVYNADIGAVLLSDGTLTKSAGVYWPAGTLVTAFAASATKALFQADGAYQGASDVTLNEAYQFGNTITTSSTYSDVIIAGTQKLDVTATGGVSVTNDLVVGKTLDVNGSVDVDLDNAGSGFSVDGAKQVSFGSTAAVASFAITTGSSGDITLTPAGKLDVGATGAVEIDAGAASYLKVTGADFKAETTGAGITKLISAAEVEINTLLLDVNATGAVQINAAAASNFSVAGAELKLETTSSGTLWLAGAALVDLDAGANLDIDVTGTFDMLSSGAFSIDGTGASNVSATSGDLTLSTVTSGKMFLASAGDIECDGGLIEIDATKAVSIAAAEASDFTVAGANLTLTTTGSGTVFVTSAGKIDAEGTSVEINGTAASHFQVTGNDLLLQTLTSGELDLTSAGLMDVNAGSNLDIDVTGNYTLDATGTLHMAGTGNSDIEVTSGNLSITTKTSGNVTLDAIAGTLTMAGNGAVTLDSDTAGVSIGAATDSDFTVNGAGQSIKLEAMGGGANQIVKLKSAGESLSAIQLDALGTGAGIDINATEKIAADAKFVEIQGTSNSFLKVMANSSDAEKLTLAAQNSGVGTAAVDLFADEAIMVKSSNATVTVARANGSGNVLDVQHNEISKFQVSNTEIFNLATARFEQSAGVKLSVGGVGLPAGALCAFDPDGKMVKANAAAGANSPSAAQEVVRYPFAASVGSVGSNANATFQSIPGTVVGLDFDAAPTAGLVGQPVFLGAGANMGKATLTAPTDSNASIWRVGILASKTAEPNGTYKVYWHPQYLGRRPVV